MLLRQISDPLTPLAGRVELFSKMQELEARPISATTEFEFDDYSSGTDSVFEESSNRRSAGSSGARSESTATTYDEVTTPRSIPDLVFEWPRDEQLKPVEGPKGPHLFRSLPSLTDHASACLQMSPLAPAAVLHPAIRAGTALRSSLTAIHDVSLGPLLQQPQENDPSDVRSWSAQQVSVWMYNAGVDVDVIEKFEINDISGRVLVELKFDDLKELHIQSFGKRHEVWSKLATLKGAGGQVSPVQTPFEDASRPSTRPVRAQSADDAINQDCLSPVTPSGVGRRRRRKPKRHNSDGPGMVSGEPVSIVAIEELIPKPHRCSKGDACRTWQRQQQQLQRLRDEHGFPVSPDKGGTIIVAGDPGNPSTADRIIEHVVYRPTSDGVPSVVASSALLGPGMTPRFAPPESIPPLPPREDLLKGIAERDSEDTVRQFLNFQHVQHTDPSPRAHVKLLPQQLPPVDAFPSLHPPSTQTSPALERSRALPKLSIPRSASVSAGQGSRLGQGPEIIRSPLDAFSPNQTAFSPCLTAIPPFGARRSPTLQRRGTPASEMDVPVTAFPVDPTGRDTHSQSVPTNMHYREQSHRRVASFDRPAAWRRASMVLSPLPENTPLADPTGSSSFADTQSKHTHAGWMKKRKNKLLRHEWQDHHCRLQGTQLLMHRDEVETRSPIDTIDVDDYAVACSTLPSGNKITAALKALHITRQRRNSFHEDPTGQKIGKNEKAFAFQLIPFVSAVAPDPFRDMNKPAGRSSSLEHRRLVKTAQTLFVKGQPTHYFAVKSREQRIGWMREIMLAKALKQKEGYEIRHNGRAV